MKTETRVINRFGLFFFMHLGFSVATASTGFANTISLQWDPNIEADLAGYKVYYKANSAEGPFDGAGAVEGVAPIDVANQTAATITGLDPGTDYYFAVTAYNTSGTESEYSNVIAIPAVRDTTAPTVSLSSPTAGATLSGVVAVSATAADDIGVSKVEFYGNGVLLTAGNLSPLTYNVDTSSIPNGAYTIMAKAYDAAGNAATSSAAVTVLNDNLAPTVALTYPLAGTTVNGTIAVAANATDDIDLAKVEFYVNGALQAVSTAAPYSFNWNTTTVTNGAYTVSAKAYDAAGNVGEGGSVTVNILNDAAAPTITFLAPTTTYIYTPTVNVSASASDNVGISRMELYIDGVLRTTTTSASIALPVSMTKGLHSILVKAFDSSNNLATKALTVQRIF